MFPDVFDVPDQFAFGQVAAQQSLASHACHRAIAFIAVADQGVHLLFIRGAVAGQPSGAYHLQLHVMSDLVGRLKITCSSVEPYRVRELLYLLQDLPDLRSLKPRTRIACSVKADIHRQLLI